MREKNGETERRCFDDEAVEVGKSPYLSDKVFQRSARRASAT